MKVSIVIRKLLLGFVLVSIGFALGKETALRSARHGHPAAPSFGTGDKTIVYYLHASIRCVTCNAIEKLAKQVLERDFADELQTGRIEWRTANFQEDEDLARRYDIAASIVLVVRLEQGREVAFRKLDKVWTLADDPVAFAAYLGDEIREGGRR